jgi:hypothetical protein
MKYTMMVLTVVLFSWLVGCDATPAQRQKEAFEYIKKIDETCYIGSVRPLASAGSKSYHRVDCKDRVYILECLDSNRTSISCSVLTTIQITSEVPHVKKSK